VGKATAGRAIPSAMERGKHLTPAGSGGETILLAQNPQSNTRGATSLCGHRDDSRSSEPATADPVKVATRQRDAIQHRHCPPPARRAPQLSIVRAFILTQTCCKGRHGPHRARRGMRKGMSVDIKSGTTCGTGKSRMLPVLRQHVKTRVAMYPGSDTVRAVLAPCKVTADDTE
jgi:hypothetical protein